MQNNETNKILMKFKGKLPEDYNYEDVRNIFKNRT